MNSRSDRYLLAVALLLLALACGSLWTPPTYAAAPPPTPAGGGTATNSSGSTAAKEPTRTWLERFAPVGAALATMGTAGFAVAAGAIAVRQYLGPNLHKPAVGIELAGKVKAYGNNAVVAVNLKVENLGGLRMVVCGDRERSAGGTLSYVAVECLDEGGWGEVLPVWDDERQVSLLLGEQLIEPKAVRQLLAPRAKLEIPFIFPVPASTLAVRLVAQVYVEGRTGKHGAHHSAEKVVVRDE